MYFRAAWIEKLTFFTSFSWWKMYSNSVWNKGKQEIFFTFYIEITNSTTTGCGLRLTLDMFGFWEYLARFSLDKLIKGPSGLVIIEACGNTVNKNYIILSKKRWKFCQYCSNWEHGLNLNDSLVAWTWTGNHRSWTVFMDSKTNPLITDVFSDLFIYHSICFILI